MATVSAVHLASARRASRGRSWASFFATPHPRLRIVGFVAGVLLLLELGVRVAGYAGIASSVVPAGVSLSRLPPGDMWRGRPINSLGYWDDEFDGAPPAADRLRIALVGGDITLAGDATSNLADEIERLSPNIEVDHFGIPGGEPSDFAEQLARDVLARQPRVVIVCIATTEEPVAERRTAGIFEWHTLLLAQTLASTPVQASPSISRLDETRDYESYVSQNARSIATCRAADDAAHTQSRREARRAIEQMAAECRERGVEMALLLAPGEFQLSPQLAAVFCRRQQCDAATLDLEAPQRRWSALADQLEIATIDLLPVFAAQREIVFEPNSTEWNARGRLAAATAVAELIDGRHER